MSEREQVNPLSIECPDCKAAAGVRCYDKLIGSFFYTHHNMRIDAASRLPAPVSQPVAAQEDGCTCPCERCKQASSWSGHCNTCAFYGEQSVSETPKKVMTAADIKALTAGFHRCGWDVGPVKNLNPECGCMCGTVYNEEGEPIIGHYGSRSGVRCNHADERGRLPVIIKGGKPSPQAETSESAEDCCKGLAPAHDCYITCGGTKPDGSWPALCLQRSFVDGMKWWQFNKYRATAFRSEIDEAEAEAIRRYGEPSTLPQSSQQAEIPQLVSDEELVKHGDVAYRLAQELFSYRRREADRQRYGKKEQPTAAEGGR